MMSTRLVGSTVLYRFFEVQGACQRAVVDWTSSKEALEANERIQNGVARQLLKFEE